jgi:hypothetical protein
MNDGTIGTWSYRAGDWYAVFGARTTLLLPESERDRVVGLWALVDGGADFTQVLDGLLASGLSGLQGFALVSSDEGPTKILLRGDGVRASLATGTETLELDGAGSTTWAERSVEGVTALSITVADDGAAPDFPIDGGLVRVSRIDLPPAGRPAAGFEGVTVLPAAVADEPSPIMTETTDDEVTEPPAAPEPAEPVPTPDYLQPWPDPGDDPLPPPEPPPFPAHAADELQPAEPEADPATAAIPSPPSPPPFGDLPPPAAPVPGPWGDGGFQDAPPPPPPPPPPASEDSDHDGLTQAGMNADEFAREQPGIPGQPMAPSVTRPVAKLIISNGETVDVDRVVLVGRAPEARRFTSSEQPLLVTVPSPMHEISSTHVEVRPGSGADHGSAVVTDMGSTNGTVLVQPGLPPEDLKPGIAVQLIPGAIINLGDGLTIQVARP